MASKWQKYRRLNREVDNFFQAVSFPVEDERHGSPTTTREGRDTSAGSAERGKRPQECFEASRGRLSPPYVPPSLNVDSESTTSAECLDASEGSWLSEEHSDDRDHRAFEEHSMTTDGEATPSVIDAARELANVALKHCLSHVAINDLCLLLRRLGHSVPRDARTLLKTERKVNVQNNSVHFGLGGQVAERVEKGLRDPAGAKVDLHINIDGLPIFKISSVSFWVLLCAVANAIDSRPFAVTIHCGKKKPSNIEQFLRPFLDEMKSLEAFGMVIKGVRHSVSLAAVICDAPARSYVKCAKGHTGYYGCDRCTQKGERIERRQTFPVCAAFVSRTDESFRAMAEAGHHHATSPLLELGVNMIKHFPLDYMHTVCLGVVRKLLQTWVSGPLPYRLSAQQRSILSARLEETSLPSEFARQPRTLEELDRWKAVEFRSFLLYTGPVLLRDLLKSDRYKHFLCLHVAVRILLSDNLCIEMNRFSSDLLQYFAQHSGKLYGPEFLVYNVHMMCHIADDCLIYGPLDNVSAFPFENCLGQIKRLLRSNKNPLEQVSRRLSELGNSPRELPLRAPPRDVSSLKAAYTAFWNLRPSNITQAVLSLQNTWEKSVSLHFSAPSRPTLGSCRIISWLCLLHSPFYHQLQETHC
ncbi:uncharacterized protein LOC144127763 [Amblyomma americanum]